MILVKGNTVVGYAQQFIIRQGYDNEINVAVVFNNGNVCDIATAETVEEAQKFLNKVYKAILDGAKSITCEEYMEHDSKI